MSKEKRKEYSWATVFMELALRAMRRVHYEYSMWSVGASTEVSSRDVAKLNKGHGIELADEPTVCAAITQEFLGSRFTSGPWRKDGKGDSETRVFTLEREKKYCNLKERVDIFCRKCVLTDGRWKRLNFPSFIEAKRARIYRSYLGEKTVRRLQFQYIGVAKDAIKLIKEKRRRKCEILGNRYEKIHCHLLIWGVHDSGSRTSPTHFLSGVRKEITKGQQAIILAKHAERWLPLDWSGSGTRLRIDKSLWIILVEVSEPKKATRKS